MQALRYSSMDDRGESEAEPCSGESAPTIKFEVDEFGTKKWFRECGDGPHREDGPAIEFADGGKMWYHNGLLHREDGPAIEKANGDKWWWRNGERHREDGPAIEWADGGKAWCRNDVGHREDGPAREYADGTKVWCRNGLHHREDGPAFERADGTKEWWHNNQKHREDGPAVEFANDYKEWYLHDTRVTEREHRRMVELPKLFIVVCASRRNLVLKEKHCWLPAELWGYLAEEFFAL